MAFIEQNDILDTFEDLIKHFLKSLKNRFFRGFSKNFLPRCNGKIWLRKTRSSFRNGVGGFYFNGTGKGFPVFDDAKSVLVINVAACTDYTRKQLDELTEWLKRAQMGAKGLIYAKYNQDGTVTAPLPKGKSF